jgi:hypothetical protein
LVTWPWTVPVPVPVPATVDDGAVVAGGPDVVTVGDGAAEVVGAVVPGADPPDADPPEEDETGIDEAGVDPPVVEPEPTVDPATLEVGAVFPDRLATRREPVDVQATTATTVTAQISTLVSQWTNAEGRSCAINVSVLQKIGRRGN